MRLSDSKVLHTALYIPFLITITNVNVKLFLIWESWNYPQEENFRSLIYILSWAVFKENLSCSLVGGIIETWNICSLSKEQSILLRETIQNDFFFPVLCPFCNFNVLSSIKHLTAECWHPHVVLLFFLSIQLPTLLFDNWRFNLELI